MACEAEQERLRRLLEEFSSDSDSFDESGGEECGSEIQDDFTEETMEMDSDQSSEFGLNEDEVPLSSLPPKSKKCRNDYDYFTGRDGTRWKKESVTTRESNPVTYLPGVNRFSEFAKTPLECWSLFFTDEMLRLVVESTNIYIQTIAESRKGGKPLAKCTDLVEIRALFGLLYLAGCHRGSRLTLKELWNRDGTGIERFWQTMSRERFAFLLKCLRFDDLHTIEDRRKVDKLAPIRKLFELFVENCQRVYVISGCATIDVKLETFRGRCSYQGYMPKKTNKIGIEMFALVDAKTRYALNLEVYVGKQPEGPYCVGTDASSIVTRLITPISGTGRNITCNDWFTSFPLIKNLLREHRLTCVGAVRKDKKELPEEFVTTKDRSVDSSVFGFQEDMTLVSYVPSKGENVIIASSMHHDNMMDFSVETKKEPEIVTFFNATKNGVDVFSELCATYNVARKTRRWPMVLFYSLLNIAGINSQIVNISNSYDPSTHLARRLFLKQLAVSLTEAEIKRRAASTDIAPDVKPRQQDVAGMVVKGETPQVLPPGTRKKCYVCKINRKSRYFCKMCKKFICLEHSNFTCSNCYNLHLNS